MQKTTQRVWLSKDRKSLVSDGDPQADYLFAGRGASVPDSRLAGLNYPASYFVGGKVKVKEPKEKEPKQEPKEPAKEPSEDATGEKPAKAKK